MSLTCMSCVNWSPRSTPSWAARMGMAVCSIKNTKAVTLSHWRSCAGWRGLDEQRVEQRIEWLESVGHTPRSGSFLCAPNAGHSRRDLGLLHGPAMGVK